MLRPLYRRRVLASRFVPTLAYIRATPATPPGSRTQSSSALMVPLSHHEQYISQLNDKHNQHVDQLITTHKQVIGQLIATHEQVIGQLIATHQQLNEKWHKESLMVERLKMYYTRLYDEKLREEGRFNLRGGLERIAAVAAASGFIPLSCRTTTTRLRAIMQLPEFLAAAAKAATRFKLVYKHVEKAASGVYEHLSQYAHSNQEQMVIAEDEFSAVEVAALVAFFETQAGWTDPLRYKVVPKSADVLVERFKAEMEES